MRDYCDVSVVANMVAMLRAELDGAIWVVDDDEESRFYERCAHKKGRVLPAANSAVSVLSAVQHRGIEGVVALTRGGESEQLPPLFRPGVGDVASLLLSSRSVDRVLGEIGGMAWLSACGREIGSPLSRALWIARAVHVLRRRRPESVRTPARGLADWVDWSTFQLDWANLAEKATVSVEDVESIRELLPRESVLEDVIECDGSDAISVLAGATRLYAPRGIRASRGVSDMELAAFLRTGFELEELESDSLYLGLKKWEWSNPRFPLLGTWRRQDPLHVVLDHRYLDRDLQALAGAVSSIGPIAFVQVDLDHFKSVNDNLGHAEGDEAIREYGRAVRGVVGGRGEVYRRGGDEIVAFATGVSADDSLALGQALHRRINSALLEWSSGKGLEQPPTASIGVLSLTIPIDGNRLARELDATQRRAKENGRNRVEFSAIS